MSWLLWAPLVLLAAGVAKARPPVIPGLHGKHPLAEKQVGELLIGELRCAACHEGMAAGSMKEAPSLADAGSRLTPDFMKRMIADPSAAHPGTTMPGLLGAETAEKRGEIAGAITAYLSSLKGAPPAAAEGEADPYDGKELFHSVGCVACHSPRDEAVREVIGDGMVSLAHLPGKHRPGALAEFLLDPLKTRPSGRMPDMKLNQGEAAALAAYLGGEAVAAPAEAPADAERIAAGKRAFLQYNCSACHQPEKEIPLPRLAGPALDRLDPARGCLSDKPAAAPDFQLSADQRQAIRKALEKPAAVASPDERIKLQLTRMNCIACHVRDDFGGVSPKLDGFFHSTEEALGNESRIPPPLTLVGAKLRPEWLNQVLHDGLSTAAKSSGSSARPASPKRGIRVVM